MVGTAISREFTVTALRRRQPAHPASNGWPIGLEVGQRLARLVAEAPLGTTVTITTAADAESRLSVIIRVSATDDVETSRSGLADAAAVVDHVAHECADLLDDYLAVGPICDGELSPEAPAGPALRLTPRDRSTGLLPYGFRGTTGPDDGDWALPQPSNPDELARLLLLNPHVRLVQSVSPVGDGVIEDARDDMSDDVPFDQANAPVAIGTPVRVHTALVAVDEPRILPLRLREHLRVWFDLIDIDEVAGADDGVVTPEYVAAGMLRLPTTVNEMFPGLPVVPPNVPIDSARTAQDGIRVGVAQDRRKRNVDVLIDDDAMSRHIHVVGESGSGKSTLLAAVAVETARRGQGLLMLDPHGTTVDRILRELPAEARERTWVIRCGDVKNPIRLNPFAVDDPEYRDVVVSDLLAVMQQLFDPNYQGIVGPRFIHMVKGILDSLIQVRGDRASLLDVPRMLYSKDFQTAMVEALDDPDLVRFWKNDLIGNRSSDSNDVISWIASKFTNLAANKPVVQILSTGTDSFDPIEAMAQNRIVLIDLAKGSLGQLGAKMLGLLYLTRFWVAALSRQDRTPFTLLVDEASNFSAVSLPAILSEGRKFGLRVLVAHQFMGQLESGLADAIHGSVATRIVFRIGTDDARELALATAPTFQPTDLTSMPQFSAAMRLADSGQVLRPFTLRVDHNDWVHIAPDATKAAAEIEARSIRELVDPYRDAVPMRLADIRRPSPPPAPGTIASTSATKIGTVADDPLSAARSDFLDTWLARRKKASGSSPKGDGTD